MNKWRKIFTKALCMAVMLFLVEMGSIEVHAQVGTTGYKIIIPSKHYEGAYVDADEPESNNSGYWGLYELDGRPVYLFFSRIQTMTILDECSYVGIDGKRYYLEGTYYAGADGTVVPYNETSKALIETDINALLQAKVAEAKEQYGINFRFKKGFNSSENYHFATGVLQVLESFPTGSVPTIANTSVANTKKNLSFRQKLNPSDNGVISLSWATTGTYSESENCVETILDTPTIAHELGHAMERTLDNTTGGQLRNIFVTLNGGNAYNKNYYYAGNEQIYNSFMDTMGPYVSRRYAAISFAEDFAETFADAMCYTTQELVQEVGKGSMTIQYFQKVIYIKQLFNQYAGAEILP